MNRRIFGLSLVELQITIVIIAVLVVIIALFLYGPTLEAVKVSASVPLILLAMALLISALAFIIIGMMQFRSRLRLNRIIQLIRTCSPATDLISNLSMGWGMENLVATRQDEIVALLSGPIPARFDALRLLRCSRDWDQVTADDALLAGADEWPDQLLNSVLGLARAETTRLKLASNFLQRATPATRHVLLNILFRKYGHSPVPEPVEPWLSVLKPYLVELQNLDGHHVDVERVSAFIIALENTDMN